MSPAIITPLTKAQYRERFQRDTIADIVFMVQLMHPGNKNLPYNSFIVLQHPKHPDKWMVQWCERIPEPNHLTRGERLLSPFQEPKYTLKEDVRVTKQPLHEIIAAFCAAQPETITWK